MSLTILPILQRRKPRDDEIRRISEVTEFHGCVVSHHAWSWVARPTLSCNLVYQLPAWPTRSCLSAWKSCFKVLHFSWDNSSWTEVPFLTLFSLNHLVRGRQAGAGSLLLIRGACQNQDARENFMNFPFPTWILSHICPFQDLTEHQNGSTWSLPRTVSLYSCCPPVTRGDNY